MKGHTKSFHSLSIRETLKSTQEQRRKPHHLQAQQLTLKLIHQQTVVFDKTYSYTLKNYETTKEQGKFRSVQMKDKHLKDSKTNPNRLLTLWLTLLTNINKLLPDHKTVAFLTPNSYVLEKRI